MTSVTAPPKDCPVADICSDCQECPFPEDCHYEANKEKRRAYRQPHKERIAEYQRSYYQANKEAIAEKRRKKRQARKDPGG